MRKGSYETQANRDDASRNQVHKTDCNIKSINCLTVTFCSMLFLYKLRTKQHLYPVLVKQQTQSNNKYQWQKTEPNLIQ